MTRGEQRLLAAHVLDRGARPVVAAGQRQRPLLRERERVVEVHAVVRVARPGAGRLREVADAHRRARVRERRLLRRLLETRRREIGGRAHHELLVHAGELAEQRQLQRRAVAVGRDRRAVVGPLHGVDGAAVVDAAEVVVHVAAGVRVAVVPVMNTAAQLHLIVERMIARQRDVRGAVAIQVRIGVRLRAVVEKRARNRLRALQRVVGAAGRDRQRRVGIHVAQLAEALPYTARVVIGPTVVVRDVARHVVVERAADAPALLELRGLAPP
jgi:hypothetical protein